MFEYALTVKKTRNPINIDEYASYLSYIKDMFNVANVNIETTRGLHIHFLLTSEKRLIYKDLYIQPRGWSIKAVPIFNRRGWDIYTQKDLLKNYALTASLLRKVNKKTYKPTDEEKAQDPNNDSDIFYPFDGTDKNDYILSNDTPISEDTFTYSKNLFICGKTA